MFKDHKLPLPDLTAYLRRIGIEEDSLSPDLPTLNRLMKAQLTHVPFENMDVFRFKTAPDLSIPVLFDRIVTKRRGGYCFELNALFFSLLQAVGYDVYPVACRILYGHGLFMPYSHRANIVTLDGMKYFVDVGYGGPSAHCAVPYEGEVNTFFMAQNKGITELRRHENGNDVLVMEYTDQPFDPVDFIALNFYVACGPRAFFQMMPIINLTTETGSKSISGDVYKCHDKGEVTERKLSGDEELYQVLREEFGICLEA